MPLLSSLKWDEKIQKFFHFFVDVVGLEGKWEKGLQLTTFGACFLLPPHHHLDFHHISITSSSKWNQIPSLFHCLRSQRPLKRIMMHWIEFMIIWFSRKSVAKNEERWKVIFLSSYFYCNPQMRRPILRCDFFYEKILTTNDL